MTNLTGYITVDSDTALRCHSCDEFYEQYRQPTRIDIWNDRYCVLLGVFSNDPPDEINLCRSCLCKAITEMLTTVAGETG